MVAETSVNEAFERWDSDMTAPGGTDPSLQETFEAGQAAGAREEREAVVRWLRKVGAYVGPGDVTPTAHRWAADKIEAGEHRKEADRG